MGAERTKANSHSAQPARAKSKSATANNGARAVPAIINEVVQSAGRPLDDPTRSFMEQRFSQDFSRVRIHNNTLAGESANSIQARAYTIGSNIAFAAGQYNPETLTGQSLLAHELAHVSQQRHQQPGLQTKLEMGGDTDIAEQRADAAAAAVIQGRSVPDPGSSPAVIRRAPQVNCRGSVANVKMSEDSPLHRVTRTRILEPVTRRERPGIRVRPGFNADDVFIAIEWCRGSTGRVSIGGNVPEQLLDFLQRAGQAIIGGGGFEDVLEALQATDVTPFINFDIGDLNNLRITGGVDLRVGSGGVRGGSGRVEIGTDDLRVGGEIFIDERGRPTGGGVRIRGQLPGGTGRPDVDCSERERVIIRARSTFRCEKLRPAHEVQIPINVPVQDQVVRSVFFNHAATTVNTALSNSELVLLEQNLKDGFTVVRLEGLTSPEGRQGVPGTAGSSANSNFQGNDQLSLDRAEAARALVLARCPISPEDGSSDCGLNSVESSAGGERLTLTRTTASGQVQEVEGRPLQQHVVKNFATDFDESRYNTPEAQEQIDQAPSLAAKAEVIYQRLRRVEIELIRNRIEQRSGTRQVPEEFVPVSCPEDVLRHAQSCFNITTPRAIPEIRRRR